MRYARSGRITLMYDGSGKRSQALADMDRALRTLTARGYTFKALPYCLRPHTRWLSGR